MIFTKFSGAGNDFVVVDNSDGSLSETLTPAFIRGICRRALSIGADGLLELGAHPSADFRMVYYNSDGGRAAICGNGGRCIARFAHITGRAPARMRFESDGGMHSALVNGDGSVRLWLPEPSETTPVIDFDLGGASFGGCLVDSGVPHLVVFRDTLSDGAFEAYAPLLRRHGLAGPAGANVDFAVADSHGGISMRTWERGVEGETLACGTGAVAVVRAALSRRLTGLPCSVSTRGGSVLRVGTDEGGWWLEGEARPVYSGETKDPLP